MCGLTQSSGERARAGTADVSFCEVVNRFRSRSQTRCKLNLRLKLRPAFIAVDDPCPSRYFQTSVSTPSKMNSAAAIQRMTFMLTCFASVSPSHTAGALATIIPAVVPMTTAASWS